MSVVRDGGALLSWFLGIIGAHLTMERPMTPDTPIAQPPNVTDDSLAQIAHAIGPWGFVACVALVVVWKVATKYLDVIAQRKELADSALTELIENVAALKKEYEQDSVTREQRLKALDALCDSVAALQKDQDQDRELWTARFTALDGLKSSVDALTRDYEAHRKLVIARLDRTDLRVGALCDSAGGRRKGGRTMYGVRDVDLPEDEDH